jgi:poly(A) polymerase Pap1
MDTLSSSLYEKLIADAVGTRHVEELVQEIQPLDEQRKAQRTEALRKLVLLLKVWARMVVYQAGQPDKIVTQKHLKLVPYGSYRYDDTSKDSDIDLLCITSKYITRKHFFHDLCRLFEGMKEVEGFTVIISTIVPIIKMKFRGVAMDICFSQLPCNSVPAKLTLDYIAAMNIGILDSLLFSFHHIASLPSWHLYVSVFPLWESTLEIFPPRTLGNLLVITVFFFAIPRTLRNNVL